MSSPSDYMSAIQSVYDKLSDDCKTAVDNKLTTLLNVPPVSTGTICLMHYKYGNLMELYITIINCIKDCIDQSILDKQNQITTKQTEISNLASQITTLESQIATKEGELQVINDQLTAKQTELTALNTQITDLQTMVTSLNAMLVGETNATVITALNAAITSLNDAIAALQAEVTTVTGEIATLTSQKDAKQIEIDDLETQKDTLTSQKTALESEVSALQASILVCQNISNKLCNLLDRINKYKSYVLSKLKKICDGLILNDYRLIEYFTVRENNRIYNDLLNLVTLQSTDCPCIIVT